MEEGGLRSSSSQSDHRDDDDNDEADALLLLQQQQQSSSSSCFVSNHTRSMRRALAHCRQTMLLLIQHQMSAITQAADCRMADCDNDDAKKQHKQQEPHQHQHQTTTSADAVPLQQKQQQQQQHKLPTSMCGGTSISDDVIAAARNIARDRSDSLMEIWNNNTSSGGGETRSATTTTKNPLVFAIDVIDDDLLEDAIKNNSVVDFRRRYLQGNRPCLVRNGGATLLECFGPARAAWCCSDCGASPAINDAAAAAAAAAATRGHTNSSSSSSSSSNTAINREWFLQTVGAETLVPVRYQQPQQSSSFSSSSSDNGHTTIASNTNNTATTDDDDGQLLLDEDGRAAECETKMMSMRDYIQLLLLLDNCNSSSNLGDAKRSGTVKTTAGDDDDDCNRNHVATTAAPYYLKDWHLQAWLENEQHSSTPQPMTTTPTQPTTVPAAAAAAALYTVPHHFPHDLLNAFLLRFCNTTPSDDDEDDDDGPRRNSSSTTIDNNNSCDYRFVYWGPAGSGTTLHSDVLHSFSWSYNVHGSKEWTFYLPPMPAAPNNNNTTCSSSSSKNDNGSSCACAATACTKEEEQPQQSVAVVQQHAGELVFVPAGWKHSVVNLQETLSINHNWVTTHNLDLVWECVATELRAVDAELTSPSSLPPLQYCNNSSSRNSNTTTGTINSRWGAVTCLAARENMLRGCAGLDVTAFFFMVLTRGLDLFLLMLQQQETAQLSWQDTFDLVRLGDTLRIMFDDGAINLKERLEAILGDKQLGDEAVQIANEFLASMEHLSGTANKKC